MQTTELKNKDVLVLGLGRSGMAAASLLRRDGARVVVRDEADDWQIGRAEAMAMDVDDDGGGRCDGRARPPVQRAP